MIDSLSPSLLAEIFSHLPEAVIVADLERRIVYVNPAAEQLFDYSAEDLLGRKTVVLYASEDDFADQGIKRYNPASKVSMENYRVVYHRADGTPFLGVTTGGTMRDSDGTVRGFIGIIRAARSADHSLDTLQRLHVITADTSLDHAGRIAAMLTLGTEHFGLEIAIQSRIQDGKYLVEHCVDPSEQLCPQTKFDVAGTYCIHTLKAGRPTGFHYAGISEIRTHPCYQDFKLESYIGCTILVDGKVYGTLNFSGFSPCEPFSRDDLMFVQLLADTVGYQISQEKLRKELLELAETDELTGLANRRSTIASLKWQVAHSHRSREPLTVIAIDLDHFKRINDSWGHSGGDAVLVEFARITANLGREVDLCGRMGGEEFLLILSDTDCQGGLTVGERLRQRLAAEPIEVHPGTRITVSTSAGVASLQTGESLENLLARADRALYAAKQGGRDQVCVAAPQKNGIGDK